MLDTDRHPATDRHPGTDRRPDTAVAPGRPVRWSGEDAVLDAAKASLLAVGVRRTTLTEVARRAGVSRMTLYRRWPDLRSLVGDVMTREWTRVVTAATRPTASDRSGGDLDDLVDHVIATVEAFRTNPIYLRIIETDPELLLPYLTERRGATQQMIIDLLAGQLDAAARNGTVRPVDPAALAVMVLLVVQSFVLSAGALAGPVSAATLATELRRLLRGYLAPDAAGTPPVRAASVGGPTRGATP
ncbi:transcriptional regulator, TetR family [Frankia torreyi]|uniref:Transcriptional regulator, TetR family n=2 Tax=Frankiaceae TaxID=74712 RepID=A0A0D8BII7_9ACTN|nr:transcriptional regulator, TetR family [Frankia torreyi]KQM07413.1 transcriptional regulator, TetR family [Frankia sp. CpI1-P]